MKQILVVDDEDNILDLIKFNLEQEGYNPILASDGQEALNKIKEYDLDLIILDIMLPKLDGYGLCQHLKASDKYSQIPIIFLSAKDEVEDIVAGLNLGADDYLRKPFNLRELLSRIKAIIRRNRVTQETNLKLGDIELDITKHQIFFKGDKVKLSYKEFSLLKLLLQKENQVCSREKLLTEVWGSDSLTSLRTIDVHIRSLRKKFEEHRVKNPRIKTVRGRGYTLHMTD
ncbi:response regulator transcription factor [Halanaerocella petrolearia]